MVDKIQAASVESELVSGEKVRGFSSVSSFQVKPERGRTGTRGEELRPLVISYL